jgi:general secretion pathway protein I
MMRARGFTLVEVLVALMVVALGLAALMVAVSSTARTSSILRDKTIAQWIALNRLAEVRLNLAKFGQNSDTGEVDFSNRRWHYDTRYFDTSINSMKRVVVRVYAGDAKTKGNALSETIGFVGQQLSPPGYSNNINWQDSTVPATNPAANGATNGTAQTGTGVLNGNVTGMPPPIPPGTPPPQTPTVPQNPQNP